MKQLRLDRLAPPAVCSSGLPDRAKKKLRGRGQIREGRLVCEEDLCSQSGSIAGKKLLGEMRGGLRGFAYPLE
jgi:hypothetical protein